MLPLAFQERFCLSERHVRCEMYKVAEDARSLTLAQDSIPEEQVRSARFRPSVRSRPVALEPSAPLATDPGQGPGRDRPVLVALLGAGAFAAVLLVVALLLGGSGSAVPTAGATQRPDDGPVVTGAPSRTRAPAASPDAPAPSPRASIAATPILIRYEVQEGERLLKIAETFGTTRTAIVRANPVSGGDDGGTARDARPGDEIIVPVSPEMSRDEIAAVPGFLGFVEP
jgi:hypothetical protein